MTKPATEIAAVRPAARFAACLATAAAFLSACTGDPTVGQVPDEPTGTTAATGGSVQPSTPTAKPGTFTLIAGGDVLIHPALTEQATKDGGGSRDYGPLLAGIKPALDAVDVAVCHLEVPIADKSGPFKGYPQFSAPPELAPALATTGFDTCSTASNHTLDQGPTGVTNTLDALDAAKITHTGSARSQQEAATPLIRDVAGVKVGFLSYSFGFNQGTTRPAATPWLANLLAPDAVLAAARKAKQAGAEVVVASLHWGIEGQHNPSTDQQRIAKQLLNDPSIDLIIGHHAHVVQPFEKINGKWVTYGLGNLVARHEEPKGDTEEGALARFRFTKSPAGWTVDRAEYLPTLVDLGPPIRLRDLTHDTTVDPIRKAAALERTDDVVLSRKAGEAGLTRPT
ncbi:CapA family protein [Actinokineospora auranticolor]|uniref:Poly-gamma-glutamate synthesis protein (Capsule biosynthesis protein) n=1 Tax=Actinokineospora auranticolor TaxID=155976 RepID=A0A2S6GZ76_9PSEU|nr:CapA family protein [Actinokineospora auranticolor]PPK70552.1 poly-gamma-glutamate synthesis protein (capsule biosynthesis protein) [Actinokineospora auranticolor]